MKIYITLFFIFLGIGLSSNNVKKNRELLELLKPNVGWNILETTDDSITISTKNLPGCNLSAIKVEKKLQIIPDIFTEIIMDISNYNKFLSNAKSLNTQILSHSNNSIIGYQYITIDLPFFDDREYIFQINEEDKNSTTLCHWILLEDKSFIKNKNILKEVTYLSYGAGIWQTEEISSDIFNISYSLYMDPGGSIPDFLIDIINRESIVGLFRDVERQALSNI